MKMNLRSLQMHGIFRQVVLTLSFITFIYTNLFSGVSDNNSIYSLYPTAFTPAVYTFVIWAPIFIGLTIFVIYQALPSNRANIYLDTLGWPVFIAFIMNALSAFTPIGWSNLVITIALIALIFAFVIINKNKDPDSKFFWYTKVPFSLFFGWITAATVVNTFQWFSSLGFQSFGPSGILTAALFIVIAAIIGVFITLQYQEVVYGLVLIWASWGITIAHPSATPVLLSTVLLTVSIILAILWNSWHNPQRKNESKSII
jgi:hypothetical protein